VQEVFEGCMFKLCIRFYYSHSFYKIILFRFKDLLTLTVANKDFAIFANKK